MARVVDGQNVLLGGALTVRVTEDRVILAMLGPALRTRRTRVLIGEHTLDAEVRPIANNLTLLDAPRGDLEFRSVHPGHDPAPGEFVFVYNALINRGFVCGLTSIAEVDARSLTLLESPSYGWADLRDEDEIRDALPGGVVFSIHGGFLGFVSKVKDDRPVVTRLDALREAVLEGLGSTPGAERMTAGDGFLTHELHLERKLEPEELPRVDDSWGDPDFFLLLENGQQRVLRAELTPGREDAQPWLVWTTNRDDLTARLVERDLNLTEGEVEEDLALPVSVPTRDPLELTFDMLSDLSKRYPQVPQGPQQTRVVVRLREVDPERSSGLDRTPLGARPLGLVRVATGSVDWRDGDATDFWSVDVAQGGPLLCFLFRERDQALLRLDAFAPGRDDPILSAEGSAERLVVRRGASAPGRLLVRVRQVGGPAGRAGYALFLFPAGEPPDALARAMMRMIGRQSPNARSTMGNPEFAREVQTVLSEAGFSNEQLAQAFLGVLGQRTSAARHLNLHLLQAHFRPPLADLEEVRRRGAALGRSGPGSQPEDLRSKDAALLLAQRCGDHALYLPVYAAAAGVTPEAIDTSSPLHDATLRLRLEREARAVLHKAVIDAASDPSDHRIRIRALAAASAWREPRLRAQLRSELRKLLGQDPSPIVRRALERAFPPETEQRRVRLRARQGR